MREAKAYCNQIWIDIVDTSDHGKEAFQDKMPFLLYLPDREFDDETKRDCEEEERAKNVERDINHRKGYFRIKSYCSSQRNNTWFGNTILVIWVLLEILRMLPTIEILDTLMRKLYFLEPPIKFSF